MFDQIYGNKSSVWGVQWTYTCLVNNSFAILPKHNMVSNIGFTGTHQMNKDQLLLKSEEIDFSKFKHPNRITINYDLENYLFEKSGLKGLINKK